MEDNRGVFIWHLRGLSCLYYSPTSKSLNWHPQQVTERFLPIIPILQMVLTKTQMFLMGATGMRCQSLTWITPLTTIVRLHLGRHPRTSSPALHCPEITPFIRDPARISLFVWVGDKTVIVLLEDGVLIEQQVSKSDIMFACVCFSPLRWLGVIDDEHLGRLGPRWGRGEAILRGLKRRHRVTDTVLILVYIVCRFAQLPQSPC